MRKQLILTADDYGCCDFIDDGIIAAIMAGKINSVAVFVTHKDSQSRLEKLLQLKQGLAGTPQGNFGIGLHFSITSGEALAGKSSLTLASTKTERENLFREAFAYDFILTKGDDLKKELVAQLDTFRNWMKGEPIDHISHHHGLIYLSPRLFECYVEGLSDYNKKNVCSIPLRSPMSWFRKFKSKRKLEGDVLKKKCTKCFSEYDDVLLTPAAIEGMKLMMWKKLAQASIGVMEKRMKSIRDKELKSPHVLCDLIYGQPDPENLDYLIRHFDRVDLLECLGYADFSAEFMFHLGSGMSNKNDVPHGINYDYFKYRLAEFDNLMTFNLDDYIVKFGIEKITYSSLK